MGWIAVADHCGHRFSPGGLQGLHGTTATDAASLRRGTLLVETELPGGGKPAPVVYCDLPGRLRFHLSVQGLPGGGLTFVLVVGDAILHETFSHSDTERAVATRIAYSWDMASGRGHVALERPGRDGLQIRPIPTPVALPPGQARMLMTDQARRYLAPSLRFMALSTEIEPLGPMPSLHPDTPVATPQGYRPVGQLRRGDTVLTPQGEVVPVLHRVSRTVPARGSLRPVRLRAPYFGLQRDIVVAPRQRLLMSGSDVEYLFNRETVLVEVGHLVGETSVLPAESGPLATYTQLVLPRHESVIAAGAALETLFLGRLRRRKAGLELSVLRDIDRHSLPEHGGAPYPVLRPFEAVVLAEQRAA